MNIPDNFIKTGNNVIPPMPVVLVGTMNGGRPNFMTVGWCCRANSNPPMISVSINNAHLTNRLITEMKAFSVCVPGADLVRKVDYCGIVSGNKVDKSDLFEVFYTETCAVPLIRECPLNMECVLEETVRLPSNTVFIGKIVSAFARKDIIRKDKVDLSAFDPLILTMMDNHYWILGEKAGKAWECGK